MMKIKVFLFCILQISVFAACTKGGLNGKGDLITWVSEDGQKISVKAPVISGASGVSVRLTPASRAVTPNLSVSDYRIGIETGSQRFNGNCQVRMELPESAKSSLLIYDVDIEFDTPLRSDLTLEFTLETEKAVVTQLTLPELAGKVKTYPLSGDASKEAFFFMGAYSADKGERLALPALNVHLGKQQLAVATDPYFGANFNVRTVAGNKGEIKLSYKYTASKMPLKSEKRKFAFLLHNKDADGMLSNFYNTIPDIAPGAAWTHEIHLNYYDYFSKNGKGWYANIEKLAAVIPAEYRKHAIVNLHGWYDYIGGFAYDFETKKISKEWKIVELEQGVRREYAMTLDDMHKRIRYAKDLGFRVAFYYADGFNRDSGLPGFRQDWIAVNVNENSKGFLTAWQPGWGLGKVYTLNPSLPETRQVFINALRALLEEFGKEVDAFVWDETFYAPVGIVTKVGDDCTYTDREYMYLAAELTRLVQSWQKINPNLAFLASDCLGNWGLGISHAALVTHGTYEDTAQEPSFWPVEMLNNYRNCLMSCLWYPVSKSERNKIAAEEYGIPQGLSDGYQDCVGPAAMKPELLNEVIERFLKNVKEKRQRTKYLTAE
ncbi:hypothetical protein AGMMS49982_20480 [Bacteroidia bacterium]|nr:hypothetical protein AGMMS49982_20480 [Bacteroidia bacterium]